MPKQNSYEDFENFSSRLTVETTYGPGDVRDHRDGFQQQQYFRNMQDKPVETEGKGFPKLNNTVKAPKPKPKTTRKKTTTDKQDAALKKAAKEDLSNRGL